MRTSTEYFYMNFDYILHFRSIECCCNFLLISEWTLVTQCAISDFFRKTPSDCGKWKEWNNIVANEYELAHLHIILSLLLREPFSWWVYYFVWQTLRTTRNKEKNWQNECRAYNIIQVFRRPEKTPLKQNCQRIRSHRGIDHVRVHQTCSIQNDERKRERKIVWSCSCYLQIQLPQDHFAANINLQNLNKQYCAWFLRGHEWPWIFIAKNQYSDGNILANRCLWYIVWVWTLVVKSFYFRLCLASQKINIVIYQYRAYANHANNLWSSATITFEIRQRYVFLIPHISLHVRLHINHNNRTFFSFRVSFASASVPFRSWTTIYFWLLVRLLPLIACNPLTCFPHGLNNSFDRQNQVNQ